MKLILSTRYNWKHWKNLVCLLLIRKNWKKVRIDTKVNIKKKTYEAETSLIMLLPYSRV